MSLAMAAVVVRLASTKRARIAWLVIAGSAGLYAHNLAIQELLYEHGACQSRFLASVDALLTSTASYGPHSVRVVLDPGVPFRVAIRAVSYRERYRVDGVPNVTFEAAAGDAAATKNPDAIRVRMTTACTLVPVGDVPRE